MSQKNTIFIIILTVLGLAAIGYFKAVSPLSNQGGNWPKIEILPKTYNFGEIKYGKILKYSFRLRNSGKNVLRIKKVVTSCGCTTAQVEKKKVKPGEEINLHVSYNTGAMSGNHARGRQERIIYIKSNDPVYPQTEVTIYAYVK